MGYTGDGFEMLKHLGPVIYAKSNLGHGLRNN